MARTDGNRRLLTTVGIVLAVALCGVVLIATQNSGVSAQTAAQVPGDKTDQPVEAAPTRTDIGSAYGSLVKMIVALVVVIACIYGGMYVLGRIMGKRGKGAISGNNLELIETTYVGPKKTVSLLRVGEKAVLVGVTDNGITMLTELDQTETASLLAAQEAPGEEPFGQFVKSASDKVTQLRRTKDAVA